MTKVVLDDLARRIDKPFLPLDIAQVDGVRVKLVRIEGAYPRHVHPDRTEVFLVHRGSIGVQIGEDVVRLGPGEAITIPGGTSHCSFAEQPAYVVVIESREITQQTDPGTGPAVRVP